ncbi:MAG TPA: hypothetical protein VN605_11485, partial [Thermoanaerobaculia bacterium]|nr:hypothetical protein [Thermoanaerobaculia bacterium]
TAAMPDVAAAPPDVVLAPPVAAAQPDVAAVQPDVIVPVDQDEPLGTSVLKWTLLVIIALGAAGAWLYWTR